MKMFAIPLAGAALLLTFGLTAASAETAPAAPAVSVAANASEITLARLDRRYRPRCYRDVHYGWRNRACVRVNQLVCRNRYGRTYVTNRSVIRVARWHCR